MSSSLFDEPKFDSHCHVLDPARVPYAPDVAYRPAGQEMGTLAQYLEVMDAYGIRQSLLVGLNSGYGLDNRCLLDALQRHPGRFRGIAVVRNDIPRDELLRLREAGVVGVAFNATLFGTDFYADTDPLLRHLADLDMFIQVQAEHNQLVALRPLLERNGARILIDHCGRPARGGGLDQPGFQALLALARTGRAARCAHPGRLFLGLGLAVPEGAAPARMGPLIRQVERLLPDPADRRRLWWETPRHWLGLDNDGRHTA